MITPLQAFLAVVLSGGAIMVFFTLIAVTVPTHRQPRAPKTRFHWNDERAIAKLRHPSSRADVWECWDPRCDCHLGRSLPYDWEYDHDLT